MSGWEGSDRRERLPANWEALRAERLRLDGHRCTWRLPSGARCPRRATDVDHKIAMADDDRIEALQSLCAHHHGRKTAVEALRAKRSQARKRYRPAEGHPGRLS